MALRTKDPNIRSASIIDLPPSWWGEGIAGRGIWLVFQPGAARRLAIRLNRSPSPLATRRSSPEPDRAPHDLPVAGAGISAGIDLPAGRRYPLTRTSTRVPGGISQPPSFFHPTSNAP